MKLCDEWGIRDLVEGGGDDCVLEEKLEGDDFEGRFVRGFEDDGARSAGLLNVEPAACAHAPAVTRLEAGESVLRHGCREVVAEAGRGGKKLFCDDAADRVHAEVVGAGVATAIAIEAGYGVDTTGFEGLTEDVFLGCELRAGV
jgi:hypothetical protein